MNDDLTTLLKYSNPEVQALILETRELILKTVPGVHEKVYLGWRTIGYSAADSMKDSFCAIDPQRTRINFVFHHGVDLPDLPGNQASHLLFLGKILEGRVPDSALLRPAARVLEVDADQTHDEFPVHPTYGHAFLGFLPANLKHCAITQKSWFSWR